MRVKMLAALTLLGLMAFVSQATAAGNHKRPKHPSARAVTSSRNNLPPGFGSASGSSGEGTTDGVPPPDEPADDGDDQPQPTPPVTGGDGSQGTPKDAPPQVVKTPTQPGSGAVTTVTAPKPKPMCLNYPDFTMVPEHWSKDIATGNCYEQVENNVGLCKGDRFYLTAISKVKTLLDSGYGLGIYVDGAGPERKLNCIITDLVTYGLNPKNFVFSGMYVQDGGPGDGIFNTPTPYVGMGPLYAFWVPGTAPPVKARFVQTHRTVQAHGLVWGGKLYRTPASFRNRLRHEGATWQGWKRNHSALAGGLIAHDQLSRRVKR